MTPGASGLFPAVGGEAQLALNTFNPTGSSIYGMHAKTLESFSPSAAFDIALSVRMRLTTVQPGLVFGIYFFGCDAGPCATHHDELDIELVTNFLQPARAHRVQLNRYAAEPLGAGHGPIVDLPPAFDPLAYHDWRIVWGLDRVTYSVDGIELHTATDFIPQGAMQANVIVWAPAPEWPDAFSASLEVAGDAALDQSFVALIDSVSVGKVAVVPEQAEWLLMAAGLAVVAARYRCYVHRSVRS